MTDPERPHIPVLLDAVLSALGPIEGRVLIDGTFGAGGYTTAFLEHGAQAVIAIDRDPEAASHAATLSQRFDSRLHFRAGNFAVLDDLAADAGFETVDAVVLDVGVSSMQLDQPERGFSFQTDGPLDMRMAQDGPSAADLVNGLAEEALADVLYRFGEERLSRRIARRIVARRVDKPFDSTSDLAAVIAEAVPVAKPRKGRPKPVHPATRSFQALRIAVNNELESLAVALGAAERLLAPGGVLAVVSFHSLEDRIVKRFLAERSGRVSSGSRHEPAAQAKAASFDVGRSSGIVASEAEIDANPRARSARLRWGVRTDAPAHALDMGSLEVPQLQQTSKHHRGRR